LDKTFVAKRRGWAGLGAAGALCWVATSAKGKFYYGITRAILLSGGIPSVLVYCIYINRQLAVSPRGLLKEEEERTCRHSMLLEACREPTGIWEAENAARAWA